MVGAGEAFCRMDTVVVPTLTPPEVALTMTVPGVSLDISNVMVPFTLVVTVSLAFPLVVAVALFRLI